MNKPTLIAAAIFPALVLLNANASANLSDEAIRGRIRNSSAGHARVCFKGAAPSVGLEFDVIRHRIRALAKGPATIESTQVGIVRIASVEAGNCADAMLVSGAAQGMDWVAERKSP